MVQGPRFNEVREPKRTRYLFSVVPNGDNISNPAPPLGATLNNTRNSIASILTARSPFRLRWFVIPVLFLLPIFAHGCHAGDHDDEPSVIPFTHSEPEPIP